MILKKIPTIIFIAILLLSIPCGALGEGVPTRMEIVALEYHMCELPPTVDRVGPEPRELYYRLHLQIQNREVNTVIRNVRVNITDITIMPLDPETGELEPGCLLEPFPTSFGSNWMYWYVGDLEGSRRFEDWYHIAWEDKRRVVIESLGFYASRSYDPKEIPADENEFIQTVIVEVRPVERDKVLHVTIGYGQKLILAELIEYSHEENVIVLKPDTIEWVMGPPLNGTYRFYAKFKLMRRPRVAGTVEVIPWSRVCLRTVTVVSKPNTNAIDVSLEDGTARIMAGDTTNWSIMYEKSRTAFLAPLERAVVGEVVISDLSHPRIYEMDDNGWIYFSEIVRTEEDILLKLKRFHPYAGKVEDLVSHRNMKILVMDFDRRGNVYYSGYNTTGSCVYKFSLKTRISEPIYSTFGQAADTYVYIVTDLAIDAEGNLYLCQQRFKVRDRRLIPQPPSKLLLIPRRTEIAVCLLELEDSTFISGILVHPNPVLGIFFVARRGDGVYLYQYVNGELKTVLKRPIEYIGRMCTALSRAGDLYYVYKRGIDVDGARKSYLEVGKFTVPDLKEGKEPRILFSRTFNVPYIGIPYPYLKVSVRGDVLFIVFLFNVTQATAEIVHIDFRTGAYSVLVSTPNYREYLTFAVGYRGDIYYAMRKSGLIARIEL